MAVDSSLGLSSEEGTFLQKKTEAAASRASRLAMRLDAMAINAALAEGLPGFLMLYANQRLQHFHQTNDAAPECFRNNKAVVAGA